MISADVVRSESGFRLTLSGHANYGEERADIVCAAVSGIFYALCGYLANTYKEGLRIYSLEPGLGDLECAREGEEAMRFACIGLLQIALSYPGYLSLNNRAFNWRVNPAV